LKEQKKVTINQKKIEDVLLRHPLLLLRLSRPEIALHKNQ